VTRDLFGTLMDELHILQRFREFVLLFGSKFSENEIGPPQLRFRAFPESGREGRPRCFADFGSFITSIVFSTLTRTDCAYGLRYVELNNRVGHKSWSNRQTAIYHKYRARSRTSTWVMISPSRRTEIALDRYVRSCSDLPSLNPFKTHVILLDIAVAKWRPYIIDLTGTIMQQVR
jgi:hypothetical protein